MSRLCEWDGTTLPYRPDVPVMLCWYGGSDHRQTRVVVPDSEGFYWNLVPGRKYVERQLEPALMFDCTVAQSPTRDASTQVDWYDLPPISEADRERFVPPGASADVRTALSTGLVAIR
jgi:hypothetical protein